MLGACVPSWRLDGLTALTGGALLQIQEKHALLERAHGGLKALEQSLDRSEAEHAASRADAEARVAAITAHKADLERQLRSTGAAAAAARVQGAAARVHALEARLQGTRAAKMSAEQQLRECRVRRRWPWQHEVYWTAAYLPVS